MRLSPLLVVSLLLVTGVSYAQPIVEGGAPATPTAAPPEAVEADARTAFNSLYVELGGNGAWYSLNYDRIVHPYVSIRAGFMYMSVTATASSGSASASSSSTWMAFPIMGNFLVGSDNHKLELGAGLSLWYFSTSASAFGSGGASSGVVPTFTGVMGYRYVPADGGFTFRAGFTPFFNPDLGFFPWGGISFGAVF